MPFIVFDRVTVRAGSRTLLEDLSFTVREGERFVLVGPSGSGKSTVLKTLLGLHPLAAGRLLVAGRPLDREGIVRLRASAAFIGQEPLLGAERVRDAILLPFRFAAHRGRDPSPQDLLATLERLRLPPQILDRECSRVSGGEKQRLALARALLLGKNLYLLDEATSALDPDSKEAVLAALDRPDLTLLAVAHDPDFIAWCGTVQHLDNGRLGRAETDGRG